MFSFFSRHELGCHSALSIVVDEGSILNVLTLRSICMDVSKTIVKMVKVLEEQIHM